MNKKIGQLVVLYTVYMFYFIGHRRDIGEDRQRMCQKGSGE